LLQRRLAEVTTVSYIPRENIRVDELISDLLEEHKVNGRKSTSDVEARWRLHLQPFFTRRRATDVTTDLVRRHISLRLQEGAENATINRELSLLKRAFNLARECTPPKVRIVPYIPMLKESNVRKGFLEWEQRDRLANKCTEVGLCQRVLSQMETKRPEVCRVDLPRSEEDGRAQHGASWRAGARRHDCQRAQDSQRVRSLPYRLALRHRGSGAESRGEPREGRGSSEKLRRVEFRAELGQSCTKNGKCSIRGISRFPS
jgi:hypothetical protein